MSTSQAAAKPRANLWILGPGWDLLLFVGTPLLILPGMWMARERWSVEEIALFVASFGALGHHLPGMIRAAYGDRALFERFKTRFLVAPVFLGAVCVAFTIYDLSAILLAVYLWGVWHGMMQTYGFVRIYDAKVKSFAPTTSRIDWWMCASWFGAAVFLSETRLANVLQTFYQAGGPLIPGSVVQGLRWAGLGMVVVVTALFLAHTIRLWRQGSPPSPIKLLLMGTSFGFWWYSNVLVANLLVGVALFEIFHDVQYLSIVFLYNEKRAGSAGDQLTSFARFLFRRSGSLVGLYVGLVFAYGSLNYVSAEAEAHTLQRVLMGLLLASTLLHFYYDGFIWKVREKSTRSSLGLEGGKTIESPGWAVHGARWALFAAPLLFLGAIEVGGAAAPPRRRAQAVADAVPDYAMARYDLGVLLGEAGDLESAAEEYRKAIEADPDQGDAHFNLGNMALQAGRNSEAIEHFRESLRVSPESATALGNLGNALLSAGRGEEAVSAFRRGVETHPDDTTLRGGLGNALSAKGQVEAALVHYRAAVEIDPELAPARYNLANASMTLGRLDDAIAEYFAAVRIDPDLTDARFNLGNALAQLGRHGEAAEQFRAAARQEAGPEAYFNLGNSLLALERLDDAETAFRSAIDADHDFAPAVHNLEAMVLHARGELEQALAKFHESVRLDPAYADAHHNLGVLLMQLGRRDEGRIHLDAARRLSGG